MKRGSSNQLMCRLSRGNVIGVDSTVERRGLIPTIHKEKIFVSNDRVLLVLDPRVHSYTLEKIIWFCLSAFLTDF